MEAAFLANNVHHADQSNDIQGETKHLPLAITALSAAVLALLMTALAINVTVHRAKLRILVGDDGNPHMLRMIRLHGNAAEHIPLALILMAIYEINGGAHTALHAAGIVLVAARLLHVSGMWSTPNTNFGRVSGQSLTWLTTVALAVLNIVKTI
jgi:uncharacterized membrane protein YecN with MAPEG domain